MMKVLLVSHIQGPVIKDEKTFLWRWLHGLGKRGMVSSTNDTWLPREWRPQFWLNLDLGRRNASMLSTYIPHSILHVPSSQLHQAVFDTFRMISEEARSHSFDMDRLRDSFESDETTAAGSDVESPLAEKVTFMASRITPPSRLWHFSQQLASSVSVPVLASVLKSTGALLLPSFLRRQMGSSPPQTHANTIAALDGLRGLACLFVFNEHLSLNFTDQFMYGYGVQDRRTFVQLPFVRVMWSGFSMVSIFFVISGYVLSYKPLKQIRARDTISFQKTLTSSVLRRALRLYLPTIIATMICGLLVSLGAFTRASAIFNKDNNYLALHEGPPPILDGFCFQMYDTAKNALQMLNFWAWTDDLSAEDYDRHYWTIVVEFRSSMVLFLFLLGTSRLKQAYRLLNATAFMMFCIFYNRKEILLFISGMLIAELDLIRKATRPSLLPDNSSRRPLSSLSDSSFLWPVLFAFGLFLCSAPVFGSEETFGFHIAIWLVPSCFNDKSALVRAVGAIFVTWAAANSNLIKPIFTNRFSIYLGKISFALYLVHGNVLKSLLFSAMPTIYGITNDGTKADISTRGILVSWMLGAMLVLPVTFWLSDLFTRVVDLPCVNFARWFEGKVCVEDEMVDTRRSHKTVV